MPTLKKRTSVILSPELELALDEYQEATGVSPAKFIAWIAAESIPMIRNLTRAAIAARKSPERAILLLQSAIDQGLENAHRNADLFEQETKAMAAPGKPKATKRAQSISSAAEGKKVGRSRRQIQAEQPEA